MADREKVIKGLEICSEHGSWHGLDCEHNEAYKDCPYRGCETGCVVTIAKDAIELLKEQEAVEPSFKQGENGIFVWCCGSCGAYMYHIYDGIDNAKEYAKYCRQCGKRVKWAES